MRVKKCLGLMLLTVLLAGCRIPGHVRDGEPARLDVGMTRDEVIRKLGRPESVTTEGDAEVFGYTLERPWFHTGHFRVRLVNGKVKSYEVTKR